MVSASTFDERGYKKSFRSLDEAPDKERSISG
jgi:hypothetical protein